MSKKPAASTRTGPAKAGKRHGSHQSPPAPSEDNLSRSIMGEQQFVAQSRPSNTSCVCCQTFDGQRLSKHCRFDSGLRYDASRKRIITLARKEVGK